MTIAHHTIIRAFCQTDYLVTSMTIAHHIPDYPPSNTVTVLQDNSGIHSDDQWIEEC
jgi:hypothetical protein